MADLNVLNGTFLWFQVSTSDPWVSEWVSDGDEDGLTCLSGEPRIDHPFALPEVPWLDPDSGRQGTKIGEGMCETLGQLDRLVSCYEKRTRWRFLPSGSVSIGSEVDVPFWGWEVDVAFLEEDVNVAFWGEEVEVPFWGGVEVSFLGVSDEPFPLLNSWQSSICLSHFWTSKSGFLGDRLTRSAQRLCWTSHDRPSADCKPGKGTFLFFFLKQAITNIIHQHNHWQFSAGENNKNIKETNWWTRQETLVFRMNWTHFSGEILTSKPPLARLTTTGGFASPNAPGN